MSPTIESEKSNQIEPCISNSKPDVEGSNISMAESQYAGERNSKENPTLAKRQTGSDLMPLDQPLILRLDPTFVYEMGDGRNPN